MSPVRPETTVQRGERRCSGRVISVPSGIEHHDKAIIREFFRDPPRLERAEDYGLTASELKHIRETQHSVEFIQEFLYADFVQQVEAFRHSMKLNYEALAQRAGTDPPALSRWLKRRGNMTVRTMAKLARAVDCTVRVKLVPLQ